MALVVANETELASGDLAALEQDLIRVHGFVLDSEALWRLLCYPTRSAFQLAVKRGACPIAVFSVARRRGYFALTKSVATWLATAAASGITPSVDPDAPPLARRSRHGRASYATPSAADRCGGLMKT